MADLDHEYCVRYYDSFIDDGKLNIVMEYCDRCVHGGCGVGARALGGAHLRSPANETSGAM